MNYENLQEGQIIDLLAFLDFYNGTDLSNWWTSYIFVEFQKKIQKVISRKQQNLLGLRGHYY